MKLKSARQAWHDCYLYSQVSPLEIILETAQLCARVQYSDKLNTANKAAHQAQAGMIQSTIATLPVPLQILGHWLYAPEGVITAPVSKACFKPDPDEEGELVKVYKEVPGYIENLIWRMIAAKLDITDQDSSEWYLIHCTMHAYRELVWGRETLLKRPRYIASWISEQHGVEMDTRNFYRGLGKVQADIIMLLDDLDMKALEPVAKVIAEMNYELQEGEASAWNGREMILI